MKEKFNADSYVYNIQYSVKQKIIVIYRRYKDTVLYNDNNIIEYNLCNIFLRTPFFSRK